jgi:hypothetical protein
MESDNNIYLTALKSELSGSRKPFILNLILKRIQQPYIEDYSEMHHIFPESWGGPTCKDNFVKLSAREHFLVHYALAKCTANGQKKSSMIYAISMMMFVDTSKDKSRYVPKSKLYAATKKMSIENQIGKKRSQETKNRISKANKGKKMPEFSKDHRDKISQANKGEKNPMYNTSLYEIWLKKHGKEEADIKYKQLIEKQKKSMIGKNKGKKRDEDFKKKRSEKYKGEKNPMHGKRAYDIWVEKYGKEEADKREAERIQKWKEKAKYKFSKEEEDFIIEKCKENISENKIIKAFNEKFNKNKQRPVIRLIREIRGAAEAAS